MPILEKLFPRSPFGALTEHAAKVREVLGLVPGITEALLAQDWERLDSLHRDVTRVEHEADLIKHRAREQTPKSLFMSIPRGDLMRMINEMDDIADTVEDYSVVVTLRQTLVPEFLREEFRTFTQLALAPATKIIQVCEGLAVLAQAAYGGPEAQRILSVCGEVSTMEWEADKAEKTLIRRLCAREKELDPLTVVFVMKILATVSSMANHAENCSDNVRHLVLTSS